jgi:hypothetical protein
VALAYRASGRDELQLANRNDKPVSFRSNRVYNPVTTRRLTLPPTALCPCDGMATSGNWLISHCSLGRDLRAALPAGWRRGKWRQRSGDGTVTR